MAEQDDAQGQAGRHHPGGYGAPGRRRAHLRPLGTVHRPQWQGQGRPPGIGGLDGYAEPGYPGRRDLCEGQRRHPEGVPGENDLHGGRPEAAAHRQREGLHQAGAHRPEPEEAEHRLRLRRRDRGLLSEHRHPGRRPGPPLSGMGQGSGAVIRNGLLPVLQVVRLIHRYPHRLQDRRQAAQGRGGYAGARGAADHGGVL